MTGITKLEASILWGNGWHARGLTTQKDK